MEIDMEGKLDVVDMVDLIIPEKIVQVPGTNTGFRVRGLPLDLMMKTFKDNVDALDALLNGDTTASSAQILESSPELVAHIIASASGGLEGLDKVRQLPTQVQALALQSIFELTFPDEELLGKFWAWLESNVTSLATAYKTSMGALVP